MKRSCTMKKIILLGLTALLGACHSMNPAPKASLEVVYDDV